MNVKLLINKKHNDIVGLKCKDAKSIFCSKSVISNIQVGVKWLISYDKS